MPLFFYGNNNELNWNLYKAYEGFQISTIKLNCTDASKGTSKEYLFLKIENTSNKPLQLNYKIEKWYDGVCSNCDSHTDESSQYSIELSPGEVTQGSCENYRNRKLAVFSKMTGTTKARELNNFNIIPLSLNGVNLKK